VRKFLTNIKNNQLMYFELTKNDFKARFLGSYLGVFWGFIQPLITIVVYWFVFQVGLRSGDRPDGTSFTLWLICGMIPWFYISEALGAATNSFLDYSYLVKKINFKVEVLPFIKIGSVFVVHIVFVIFLTIVLNFYGYQASWMYLQLIYYIFASTSLISGMALITSTLAVFFRDTSQIVGIFIQLGFWALPIVWGPEVLSGWLQYIFQLNPAYYIVEGFRETLLTGGYFWEKPLYASYFWIIVILLNVVGTKLLNKLKGAFSDVL